MGLLPTRQPPILSSLLLASRLRDLAGWRAIVTASTEPLMIHHDEVYIEDDHHDEYSLAGPCLANCCQ
jgi:hypothetical protein